MSIFRPARALESELLRYHSPDYIRVLRNADTRKKRIKSSANQEYGIASDCPLFPEVFDFSTLYTGGSLAGARMLSENRCDVAINW